MTPTLARYQALRVRYINFMQDDDLDVTQFDVLANEIVDASGHVVVLDTGSSNFIPMVNYLKGNGVLECFRSVGATS